jgi:hypothetical protein
VGDPASSDDDEEPHRGPAPQVTDSHQAEAGSDGEALPLTSGPDHGSADAGRQGARPSVPDVRSGGNGLRPHPGRVDERADDAGEPSASVPSMPRREVTFRPEPRSETTEGGDAAWKSATLWSGGFP